MCDCGKSIPLEGSVSMDICDGRRCNGSPSFVFCGLPLYLRRSLLRPSAFLPTAACRCLNSNRFQLSLLAAASRKILPIALGQASLPANRAASRDSKTTIISRFLNRNQPNRAVWIFDGVVSAELCGAVIGSKGGLPSSMFRTITLKLRKIRKICHFTHSSHNVYFYAK